jgi:NADP-dependent 3-hydroxy acid dehydrogenase YdfG
MSHFSGRVAMVTGAGSGIGKALVEELAKEGATVVFGDRDFERVQSLAHTLGSSNGRMQAVKLDVTRFDDFNALVKETVKDRGHLDFLFNNAGIAVGGEARDYRIEDWRDVIDVNLNGVVNGVAAAYPVMVSQGSGHIVNVASIEGLVPLPNIVSYAASKFGVVGLSNVLRIEGAGLGVKVSVVCPGHIKTRIYEESKMINLDRAKMLAELGDRFALTPEECARQILKGVERNQRLIIVTRMAKFLWWFYRNCPELFLFLMRRLMEKSRREFRTENTPNTFQ